MSVVEVANEFMEDGVYEMRILDDFGDTKMVWDPGNPDEVENARRTFNDLRSKGYQAYTVKKRGGQGEIIGEFDPEAGRVIMAPAMRGG